MEVQWWRWCKNWVRFPIFGLEGSFNPINLSQNFDFEELYLNKSSKYFLGVDFEVRGWKKESGITEENAGDKLREESNLTGPTENESIYSLSQWGQGKSSTHTNSFSLFLCSSKFSSMSLSPLEKMGIPCLTRYALLFISTNEFQESLLLQSSLFSPSLVLLIS